MSRMEIFCEVDKERARQDQQWGGSDHDDAHTVAEWQDYIFHQMVRLRDERISNDPDADFRMRFVKIAALAFAAIESIDRRTKA